MPGGDSPHLLVQKYKVPSPLPRGGEEPGRAILALDFPVGLAETLYLLHSPASPSALSCFLPFLPWIWNQGTPKCAFGPKSASQSSLPGEHNLWNQVSVGGEKNSSQILIVWENTHFWDFLPLIIKKERKKKRTLWKFTRSFFSAEWDALLRIVSLCLPTFTLVSVYLEIWIAKPTWSHCACEIWCRTENNMRNRKDKAFVGTRNAEHYGRMEYFW